MRRLRDYRAEVAQSMHRIDIDLRLWHHLPRGMDVWNQVARRERPPSPVVKIHPVWRRRGKLAFVERDEISHQSRPRMPIGGRFSCQITGFELRKGGLEVVGVENDCSG